MTDYSEITFFVSSEFDSPDAPGSGDRMNQRFVQMIDKAREIADVPFHITSGFRTERHNATIGGTLNSAHLRGYAADIACTTGSRRMAIVKALIEAGFRRIGIAETFVHCDCDPELPQDVIWTY